MKKTKFFIALVSIILLASLLLSACSSSTTTTPPANTPAATSAAPTTTAASPAAATAPAKVYNLKFSYHTPPQASMVTAYFQPWAASIEKASGGQVKITHYAGESLVKAKDQYDAVVNGLCDIAMFDAAETPGRFPRTEFDTLPYIFPTAEIGAQVFWDIMQKYSLDTELKEVKLLGTCTLAGSHYAGNKPAQKVEDFKGMRVRTAGRTESWTVEALGASPVEIATSDLYTSLERSLVDGSFLTWSAILSFGVKDVTKYRTECNLYSRTWNIVMNKKTWDSLPADVQKVFTDNSGGKISAMYSAANEKLASGAKGAIAGSDKGAGKPAIYTLSADEMAAWKTAVMPVWDKWASDMEAKKLPGKAIIEDVKSLVQKYSTK